MIEGNSQVKTVEDICATGMVKNKPINPVSLELGSSLYNSVRV